MKILGISAFYHDSAAALVIDGKIFAAAQQERFSRKKHDFSFPTQAIAWCLDYAGLGLKDLDYVAFYDKPYLKFERLLETYYVFAPKGLKSFLAAIPVWIKEKLFLKRLIREELRSIDPEGDIPPLLFPEHHLSHAASAFYPSPFPSAAILTIDGVGEWATTTIGHGKGNSITIFKELHFPHSLGLLYSAFTYYCGFKVNSGEYKLMGLAPYGNPHSDRTKRFIKLILEELIDLKPDGSIWINMEYFDFATGLTMTNDEKWERLFGLPRRLPETEITQGHMDLAYAIQKVTEEAVFRLAQEAKRLTGEKYLTLAGGVALNCVANGKILKAGIFDDIWIQPAAGDAGGALGAALAVWHIFLGNPRKDSFNMDAMSGAFLGP